MSRLELFTKSVSRDLFKRKSSTKLTAADIRRGGWCKELDEIVEERQNDDSDLRVLELHNETVDDLLKILRPLCTKQKKSPVVFIDYLQLIPSSKENIKNGIDDTVRKLKTFQRDTNTTFIVISSFNRANYNQPVAFESFKESGGIEYSADVVFGLQLNAVNQIKGGSDTSNIRKKIDEAKKQKPRQIQLKCLKNSNHLNIIKSLISTYFMKSYAFRPLHDLINDWINFNRKSDTYSVLAKNEFTKQFENEVQQYNDADIKELIKYMDCNHLTWIEN